MVMNHKKLVNKTTCDAKLETRVCQWVTKLRAIGMNDITGEQQDIDDPNNAIQGEIIDRAAGAMDDLVNENRQLLVSIISEEWSHDFDSLNLHPKITVDRIIDNQ